MELARLERATWNTNGTMISQLILQFHIWWRHRASNPTSYFGGPYRIRTDLLSLIANQVITPSNPTAHKIVLQVIIIPLILNKSTKGEYMTTITKICKHCTNTFEASSKEHNRGNALFCSKGCFKLYKRPKINKEPNVICSNCNVAFYKTTSKMQNSKSGLFFCSRSCKDNAQKLGGIKEIQPYHYGTISKDNPDHYRRIAFANYLHKCNRCNYDKHKSILEVHHIDRNRMNDDIANLEILCANCHLEEHLLKGDGKFGPK